MRLGLRGNKDDWETMDPGWWLGPGAGLLGGPSSHDLTWSSTYDLTWPRVCMTLSSLSLWVFSKSYRISLDVVTSLLSIMSLLGVLSKSYVITLAGIT